MANIESTNWCFTLNNYTPEHEELLKTFFNEYCRYMVYGREVGSKEHTPHLQGYIQLKKRLRMLSLKKKLGINTIHLEKQRAKNSEDARNYCLKDGDIVEYGEFLKFGSPKAKKDNLRQQIINCESWNDVLDLIVSTPRYLNYAKECWRNRPIKVDLSNPPTLRPWQQQVLDLLLNPDDRTIYIMCDPEGNHGKTFLCVYLFNYHKAFICGLMKSSDILFQYNNESIICFDMPRNNDENFAISGAVETLKNGYGLVGKYEGRRIYRPYPASVIIFTNSYTGMEYASKFSKDRVCLLFFNELPNDDDIRLDSINVRRCRKAPKFEDYKKIILLDNANK